MAGDDMSESTALHRFVQVYEKSRTIFEEGSTGSEMYLVRSGRVLLSCKQGRAEEVTLAVLKPGDFFGEMALVDDSPRSATASALEDNTQVIAIDRARFLFMVRQQPEFALSLMHTLCQRLRNLNRRLSQVGLT